MWLPDTNVWIAYLNPRPSPVKQQMRAHSAADIQLCDVVKAELFYGAYKSQRREANLAVLDDLCAGFRSLPFDGTAAREFGRIRAELEKLGKPIGPYDLQIAAIALVHGMTLVTHNTSEFSRVPGLLIEDWE
jgi:tRNA(fMet)-specific endonuclease VapC